MGEIAVEVPPDSWQMGEVGVLAIPPREAVEDADDPHRALRTEYRVGRAERCLVEAGRCAQVARDHRSLQPGAEVAPRVLKQRDEVVGDGARTRVLKVQQTDPAEPTPVAPAAPVAVRGQPHQVAGVKIPQAERPRTRRRLFERPAPCRLEIRRYGCVRRLIGDALQEEFRVIEHPACVITGQVGWHRPAVKIDQKIGCRLVEPTFDGSGPRAGEQSKKAVVAEIFEQGKPLSLIGREHVGGAVAHAAQQARNPHEGPDGVPGRRVVHEHGRRIALRESRVAPCGRIARERCLCRIAPARTCDEGAALPLALAIQIAHASCSSSRASAPASVRARRP